MTVKEFVEVSYLRMIFKKAYTHEYIYDFDWYNYIEEEKFIDEYGDCKINKITSQCDNVINVFIESEV